MEYPDQENPALRSKQIPESRTCRQRSIWKGESATATTTEHLLLPSLPLYCHDNSVCIQTQASLAFRITRIMSERGRDRGRRYSQQGACIAVPDMALICASCLAPSFQASTGILVLAKGIGWGRGELLSNFTQQRAT